MSESIWYFEDVDFYKVFCPHRYKEYDKNASHCYLDFGKEEFIYKENVIGMNVFTLSKKVR